MLSLILPTITFFVAAFFIKRYLEEQGIDKGMTRGMLVFLLAFLVSVVLDSITDWVSDKIDGDKSQRLVPSYCRLWK